MRSAAAKATVVVVVLVALTIAAIVVMTVRSYSSSCEVCVTFRGATQCREAFGPTPEEARRTAKDNACAFLASGMTASIECQNTPPDRVTCSEP